MQLDKASIILSHVKNYKAQDDSCKTHLISLLLSNDKIPKYIITFLEIFLKLTKLFSGLLQPTIEKGTRSFMSVCPFGPEEEVHPHPPLNVAMIVLGRTPPPQVKCILVSKVEGL